MTGVTRCPVQRCSASLSAAATTCSTTSLGTRPRTVTRKVRGTSGSSTARSRPAAPEAVVSRCSSGACSEAAGRLTAFGTASPRSAARVVVLMTSPTAASASALEPPVCGVRTAFG